MIIILSPVDGFTVGNTYTMMGACWDDDFSVQYDWHAINDAGTLSIIPFADARMV